MNAFALGYTATDFNSHSGLGTVKDIIKRIIKGTLIKANGPTGTFFSNGNAAETGISPW